LFVNPKQDGVQAHGWGGNKFDLAVPLVPADPKVKNESIKQNICYHTISMKYEHELQLMSFELRVTSFELRVTSFVLRVTSFELRVTSYKLQIMSMTFLDLLTNLYESSHHPYPLPRDLPPTLPHPLSAWAAGG
jgi:hypothetical protein